MVKKGQISIFLIVGFVVVAIIGLFLALGSKINLGTFGQTRVEDVQTYMESCVNDIVLTSFGDDNFKGPTEEAEIFLNDYIKKGIRTNCENDVNENFNNVEKPSEIFVEVDIKEVDFSEWQVKPADHVYERITARIDYGAKVSVEGNKFVLKPILVEHEF